MVRPFRRLLLVSYRAKDVVWFISSQFYSSFPRGRAGIEHTNTTNRVPKSTALPCGRPLSFRFLLNKAAEKWSRPASSWISIVCRRGCNPRRCTQSTSTSAPLNRRPSRPIPRQWRLHYWSSCDWTFRTTMPLACASQHRSSREGRHRRPLRRRTAIPIHPNPRGSAPLRPTAMTCVVVVVTDDEWQRRLRNRRAIPKTHRLVRANDGWAFDNSPHTTDTPTTRSLPSCPDKCEQAKQIHQ